MAGLLSRVCLKCCVVGLLGKQGFDAVSEQDALGPEFQFAVVGLLNALGIFLRQVAEFELDQFFQRLAQSLGTALLLPFFTTLLTSLGNSLLFPFFKPAVYTVG